MPLDQDTPVYPGDPKVEIKVAAEIASNGALVHLLSLGTHSATHIDAPSHMIEGGKMLSTYPIERFVGPGKLLDARDGLNIDQVVAAEIKPGDMLLLWTGISERYEQPDYYEQIPKLDLETMRELVEQKPSLIGLDAPSSDAEPFLIHKLILGKDILLAENLVGLSGLQGKNFEVLALPLKLELDAAPARIIARVLSM